MSRLAFALILIVAVTPLTIYAQNRPSTIKHLLEEAEQLTRDQKYTESNEKLQSAFPLLVQDSIQQPEKLFDARLLLANNLRNMVDHTGALEVYQSLEPMLPLIEDNKLLLEHEIGMGVCHYKLNNIPQSIAYLKSAEKRYENSRPDKFFRISNAYNFLGNYYRNQNQPDSAIYYYQRAVDAKIDFYGTVQNALVGYSYIVLGTAYGQGNKIRYAIEHYKKGIDIIKAVAGPDHTDLMQGYTYLSTAYVRAGEYYKAASYFRLAEAVVSSQFPRGHIYYAVLYSNGGELYRKKKEYNTAYEMLINAYEIFEKKLPAGHSNLNATMMNIGLVLYELERHQEALAFFKKAEKGMRSNQGPDYHYLSNVYNGMGLCYRGMKDYNKALEAFDLSYQIASKNFVPPHINLAAPHFNKAEMLQDQKKYEESLPHFEQALSALSFDPQAKHPIYDVGWIDYLLDILDSRARAYMVLYRETKQEAYLFKSLEDCELGMDIFSEVFKSFRESDIIHLVNLFYQFMEGGVVAHYKAAKESGKQVYLKRAFTLLEQSRSVLLYKASLDNKAQAYASIPNDMLEKEATIKGQIASLSEEIDDARQSGKEDKDTSLIKLDARLAMAQEALDQLLSELEEDYPSYYQLKYDFRVTGVEDIQHSLSKEAAHLAYFLGEDIRLAFIIEKSNFRVVELENDYPLEKGCERLCKSLYQELEDVQAYLKYGYQLYEKLIRPLGDLPFELIISPDGALHYLPFEILLSSATDQAEAYSTYPYLLRDHQIAYSFSATLGQAMADYKVPGEDLLVVAPEFAGEKGREYENYRRDNLAPLAYNTREGERIVDIMGGSLMQGKEASLEAFKEQAPAFSLFHFATHAKAEDYNSDYSYLAFSGAQSDTDSGKIYLRDLYALQLPAEMVVLSACETGLGEFRQGEGVLSLARGFAYAGAKSIITSLWAANDASTARLMEYYYQYISEGLAKDAALRQAKLDFLESATEPSDAHPFKWGAFIAIGDMSPVGGASHRWWLWLLGGGIALMIIYGIRKRAES